MTNPPLSIACLFDFDNTLYDNDSLKTDLDAQLRTILAPAQVTRFWDLYEATRSQEGTVDFPATMAAFRPEIAPEAAERVWSAIWDYDFAAHVYRDSQLVIAHLWDLGASVGIVSDGDPVYQPHKIAASGMATAVRDQVRIYIHKQQHMAEVFAWLPAAHYVMIDDKATILADIKRAYGDRFTTIHVRQGHYGTVAADPAPDIELDAIGDILRLGSADLMRG